MIKVQTPALASPVYPKIRSPGEICRLIRLLGQKQDFGNQQGGKVTLSEDFSILGGSAFCIVGYDGAEDEFKFAQSWGAEWGESGFGYISQSDLKKIIRSANTISI